MRKKLLLNDDWKFHCGDIATKEILGHHATYMHSKAINGMGAAAANYYDGDFTTVHLPHDYVLDGEISQRYNESQGSYYRENAWYRKHFDLPCKVDESRVVLLFDGAGKRTSVWCNGHFAGENNSMYNSFYIDITPYLLEGEVNTLAVKIDNDDIEGWWYEGAGIYRDVWMLITDRVAVDVWGTYVNPTHLGDEAWSVPVETTVYSNDSRVAAAQVMQRICDASGNVVASAQSDITLKFGENTHTQTLSVTAPTRWNLETSTMYTLQTEVVVAGKSVDVYETPFGFRTIAFDAEKGFFLNEQPVKLRGACLHQDHGNLGIAVPNAVNQYRIDQMKSIGMNSFRSAHNNPSPSLLDQCDQNGFLVLDENRWFNFSEKSQRELVAMLKRDRNHPSVIVWMVGNEEPTQSSLTGQRLVEHLKGIVNGYDTTRPVSIALNGGFYDSHAAGASDVVAVNYNIHNYDKFPIAHPGKAIVATESGASRNNRGIYFNDDETGYASAYDKRRAAFGSAYIDAIRASETHDFIAGTFVWSGIEYRGEASWPGLFSASGMFDNCGLEKDNAYMAKACWTAEPTVHVFPHWNLQGHEGEQIDMVMYANTEQVELIVNGVSQGKQDCVPFTANTCTATYQPGSVQVIGYVGGKAVAQKEWVTTGEAASMQIDCHNTAVTNTGEDTAIFKVSLQDANGQWIPDAAELLAVSLLDEAQGEILAVSGGDPLDHSNARNKTKKMFSGLLQVIVRAKAGAQALTLVVQSKDSALSASYTLPLVQAAAIPSVASSARNLSVDSFRAWVSCTGLADVANEYNFDDMNTSEPVVLSGYQPAEALPYLLFTAKAVMPECDKQMELVFAGLKGEYAIRVFHDRNAWPHPDPAEFLDVQKTGNNTQAEDYHLLLTGFGANEKIKIVIAQKNQDAAIVDTYFNVVE